MNINDIKINCSDISFIMGSSQKGLTEKQVIRHEDLSTRKKPLTQNQQTELAFLIKKRDVIPDLDLSDGCKSVLVETYCRLVKGKVNSGFIGSNKFAIKGVQGEEVALELFNKLTGIEYCVDKTALQNDFIIGKLDAFVGECAENCEMVIDAKCSWGMPNFYEAMRDELCAEYEWQAHGYMALTGAKSAKVVYVLLNTPDYLLQEEFQKVFRRMYLPHDHPDVLAEFDKIRQFYTYDDLPINERICVFDVDRDDEKIENIYKKVAECRKWLVNFDQIVDSHAKKYAI